MQLLKRKKSLCQRKMIFVHIPKNGGTALRYALRRHPGVVLSKPYHFRLLDYDFDADAQYFAVIRNPWGRVASRYFFAREICHRWSTDDPRRIYIEKASFTQFVLDAPEFEIPQHPGRPWLGPFANWYDQMSWVTDTTGQIAASLLRFEFLEEDLKKLFGLSIKIPKRNVTNAKYDYRTIYNNYTFEAVRKKHSRDIEAFGFTFEGSATKNVIGCSSQ